MYRKQSFPTTGFWVVWKNWTCHIYQDSMALWMYTHSSIPQVARFFSFWGRVVGVLDFCCSQRVPMKFQLGSQHVPNVFLNMFPIAPPLYLISLAPRSSLVTYITSPGRRLQQMYFATVQSLVFFFFFFFWRIKDFHHKRKIIWTLEVPTTN